MAEYETFEHKADVGVRGFGKSVEEAMQNAAKAMFSAMVRLDDVNPSKSVDIIAEGTDYTSLLINFLNQLLAQKDVNDMVFCSFTVKISKAEGGFVLEGEAKGEKISQSKHRFLTEVKAATFHEATVYKDAKRWIAQCIVDV